MWDGRTILERTRAVSAAWLFRCACTTESSVASCGMPTAMHHPASLCQVVPLTLDGNASLCFVGNSFLCSGIARTVSCELAGHKSCAAIGANIMAKAAKAARRRRIVATTLGRCSEHCVVRLRGGSPTPLPV
eukprot:COSAG02_NODE_1880_length_10551_cov_2.925947_7_plen_132_part_00